MSKETILHTGLESLINGLYELPCGEPIDTAIEKIKALPLSTITDEPWFVTQLCDVIAVLRQLVRNGKNVTKVTIEIESP